MNVASLIAMTQMMTKSSKLNLDEQSEDSFITHLGQFSNGQASLFELADSTVETNIQLIEAVEEDGEQLLDELMKTTNEKSDISLKNEDENSVVEEITLHFDELSFLLNDNQSIAENIKINQTNMLNSAEINVIAQIQQLIEQTSQLLNDLDETNIKQMSPKLLTVLTQLSQLANEKDNDDVIKLLDEKMAGEQSDIVKRLLTSFENRNNLVKSGAYRFEAAVTSEDIAKWLSEALNNQDIKFEQSMTVSARPVTENIQMSPIEQYVIHLNESDRVERVQEQLVRQFESVMKQSRFLKAPDLTQLSFILKPNHLGNVHVQLIEINGEMTVKMIASSLAAKKLLESNIHQLKHMFAPHNVIVERNDSEIEDVDHVDEQLDEQEEQAMNEEEQSEQHSNHEEELDHVVESFQSILHNLGPTKDGEELNDD